MLPLQVFIVSDTRAGSTALSASLAKALGVAYLGEILLLINAASFGGDAKTYVVKKFRAINPKASFVAKVMYHDLLMGQGEVFRLGGLPLVLAQMELLFPQATLIHLTRRDFVAGAYSELRAVVTKTFHVPTLSSASSDEVCDRRLVASFEKILGLARERQRSMEIANQILSGSQLSIFVIDHSDLALTGGAAVRDCIRKQYGLEIELQFEHRKIVSEDEDRRLDSIRGLFVNRLG